MSSREKIRVRREKAYQLREKGLTIARIAKELDVHENTVATDLRAVSKEFRQSYSLKMDTDTVLQDTVSKFDKLAEDAFHYAENPDLAPSARAQLLNAAMRALGEKTKLLSEMRTVARERKKTEKEIAFMIDNRVYRQVDLKQMTHRQLCVLLAKKCIHILTRLLKIREGKDSFIAAIKEDMERAEVLGLDIQNW